MPAVYIDADVATGLIAALGALGHTARHARHEPQMADAPDGKQLWLAAHSGAVLVTHNRKDFRLLHDAWRRWSAGWGVGASHGGILVVPQRTPIEILARAIHEQLAVVVENELFEWVRGTAGGIIHSEPEGTRIDASIERADVNGLECARQSAYQSTRP